MRTTDSESTPAFGVANFMVVGEKIALSMLVSSIALGS